MLLGGSEHAALDGGGQGVACAGLAFLARAPCPPSADMTGRAGIGVGGSIPLPAAGGGAVAADVSTDLCNAGTHGQAEQSRHSATTLTTVVVPSVEGTGSS